MWDQLDLGPFVLSNPSVVQSLALNDLSNRLNGQFVIADPNNGFNYMLEFGSSVVAQFVKSMQNNFDGIYPARATVSAELYQNMSDFDYLNMVSQPASTSVRLTFNADYLKANAINFNTDYNLVTIPAETIYYIGSLICGTYYPIDIKINVATGNFVVVYDDSVPNPLFKLPSNTVQYVLWKKDGLNLLTLTIPIWQFTSVFALENVFPEQGFQKQYIFTDNFYAARVFTNSIAAPATFTEMAYTLSQVYDTATPTVQIAIEQTTSTLTLSIPQIYFANNQIGNQLQIIIYTTQGAIDVTLTSAEIDNCNLNFNLGLPTITPFSSVLNQLSIPNGTALTPVNAVIVGGSNGLTFEQLKEEIVNGTLYDPLPITPQDLVNFLQKNGFTPTKYIDNITNRIYYAGITMQGGANGTIPVVNSNVQINTTNIGTTSSIVQFDDSSVMVFPTTLYKYNPNNNSSIPLTDAQVKALATLSVANQVATFNTTTYTQYPLHYVVYPGTSIPLTKTFNLMNPTVTNITFMEENVNSSAQMTLVSAQIVHQANGTGGYLLQLAVNKTTAIQSIAESNIYVILATSDTAGSEVFLRATWLSTAPVNSAYTDIYNIAIPTTYQITQNSTFNTLFNLTLNSTVNCTLNLSQIFDLKFLVSTASLPNIAQDFNITANLSSDVAANLGLVWQQLTITFGQDLSSTIFNITTATYGQQTFMTWPATVYWTYPNAVYLSNPDGTPVYSVSNGQVILTTVHEAGDTVLDGSGNPVVRYLEGSLKLDGSGNPIPLGTRNILYSVQTMQFDARLFQSQNPVDISYIGVNDSGITGQITSYANTVSGLADQLLEQTALYFLPNNTIGNVNYDTGGGVITSYPLGISFAFKIYISNYDPTQLYYQNLISLITTQTNSIISTALTLPTISQTNMSEDIVNAFPEDIISVDSLGMNGNPELQTLTPIGNSIAPTIALILVLNADGTVTLNPNITLTFVSV
jgi:hypothetical protein